VASTRDVRYLDEYLADRSSRSGRHAARDFTPAPRIALEEPASTAFAVTLNFDEFSERRVRQAWDALDEHGVPSAGATDEPGFKPHITLAIVNTPYPEHVAVRLRGPLANVAGVPVTMTALGFFLTNKAPAYLAVAPTRRLLELHDEVHRAIGDTESWSYYKPGNWMPHCTLAMDVVCQTTVAEALADTTLPIQATVGSAHLVELPPMPEPAVKPHRQAPGSHRRPDTAGKRRGSPARREVGRRSS
jgi:2'-5' RNA ligase